MPPGVVPKNSFSYDFTSGKPVGMVEDATRSEMLPLNIASSVRLEELSATGGSAANWYAQAPGVMASRRYKATATVGNRSSGTDRGALVWVGGTDGSGNPGITNFVGLRVRGQSNAVVIFTKTGLTSQPVAQVTAANALVSANDVIGLEITEAGGIYTYTATKNGTPLSGASWTDSGAVAGVPGKAWGCGGYGTYSGSYFPSLGIYAMSCADT